MKKLIILTLVCFTISLSFAQTITVGAPANTNATTQLRAPNGLTSHTTMRAHMIIPATDLTGIASGTTFTGLGFLYSAGVTGIASGNIQFYLENTTDATNLKSTVWATAITGMTSVYNGTYTIPTTATASNVTLTGTFTYTGGGLYVAYDYVGSTFGTAAATYLCDNLLAGGIKMDASTTTTAPATLTQSSGFRPEIQFSYSNPYTNNVSVTGIFPGKGQDNLLLGSTQVVDAQIKNLSSGTLTNVPVTLSITGANPYTATQTIPSITSGTTASLSFLGVPKTITGVQTVVVSVPPDQQTSNDTYTLTQNVYCDTVGYAYGNSVTGGLGYNTGAGILANLFVLPAGGPIYVKKVVPTIANAAAVTGNTIKGVILNSAGVIIDSTANHVITAAELGQNVPLTFLNGGVNHAGDSVYIGFRQVANATTGYFPLATQDIAGITPSDIFCGFGVNGGTYANYNTFGIFLIKAVLSTVNITSNVTNNIACPNVPVTVSTGAGWPTYSFLVNTSNVQTGSSSNYTFTPTTNSLTVAQVTLGSCTYSSPLNISVGTNSASTVNATFCQGTTYMFNSQAITSPGTYTATVPNSSGCDSLITLNLSYGAVAVTSNKTICAGGSYSIGTSTYTTAGTYVDTIQIVSGCDSIITTVLTVNAPLTSTIQANICAGTSYAFGGQNYSTAGTYTNQVQNASGCDSIITLNLTVSAPVNVSVTQTGAMLTASATGSTYQWISCPSNTPITGATSSSFQSTDTIGTYAVIVTTAGCADTSTCTTINQTGIDELDLSAAINLYPNPTVDLINLVSKSSNIEGYKVMDLNGRIVLTSELNIPSQNIQFSVAKLAMGTYKVEIKTELGSTSKVFIKK